MDDKLLIELLDINPSEGLQQLKKIYEESLRYTVNQRLKNKTDINDCIADTFEDFYLQRRNFDPEKGSIRAYLITIADRKAIHKFHENNHMLLVDYDVDMAAEDEIDRWENRELVIEALQMLSDEDRKIIEFRYYDGYSVKEIADIMGMNYETVKKRLQRACKKLRNYI